MMLEGVDDFAAMGQIDDRLGDTEALAANFNVAFAQQGLAGVDRGALFSGIKRWAIDALAAGPLEVTPTAPETSHGNCAFPSTDWPKDHTPLTLLAPLLWAPAEVSSQTLFSVTCSTRWRTSRRGVAALSSAGHAAMALRTRTLCYMMPSFTYRADGLRADGLRADGGAHCYSSQVVDGSFIDRCAKAGMPAALL
jgi:hypothetical protein